MRATDHVQNILDQAGQECLCKQTCQPGEEGLKLGIPRQDYHNLKRIEGTNRADASDGQQDRAGSHTVSVKAAQLGAHLKYLYANAHNLGCKQEELEIDAHVLSYGLTGITETW